MITDNAINNAAKEYCNKRYLTSQDAPFIAEGFRQGAHWAIQEFLKDLWHDAKEDPKINKKKGYIIVQFNDDSFSICNLDWLNDDPLKDWSPNGVIDRWCYIDDLLKKTEDAENERI